MKKVKNNITQSKQNKTNYVKISFGLMAIVLLSVFLFATYTYWSVNYSLNRPNHTIMYDVNGDRILPQNDYYRGEPPVILSEYFLEKNYCDQLPEKLYPENRLKREIAAYLLDNKSETERLEVLLNNLYFKYGNVGINNASSFYFNKEMESVTDLELLFLIYKTQERNTPRLEQDFYLFLTDLYQEGFIKQETLYTYEREIPSLIEATYNEFTVAQSYIQQIISELNEDGFCEQSYFKSNNKIFTYYNPEIQKIIYEQFNNDQNFPDDTVTEIEAGMVIINHENGGISALLGGRNYRETSFNRATDTTRQPSSAFKPLIVFAPAIEHGWTAESMLEDYPITLGEFSPRNWDHEYRGEITLREALVESYNVPAAWLMHEVGFSRCIDFIKGFELFNIDPDDGYALANGFTSVGTSPLNMAKAFTVFVNDGNLMTAKAVKDLRFRIGGFMNVKKPQEKQLLTKESSIIMQELLVEIVENGTGEYAQISGTEVGGKTGTTSFDGWFVGFADHYIGAVWLGPDEVSSLTRFRAGSFPSLLFKNVFTDIRRH